MSKASERYVAFIFGVVFVIVLLLLAIRYPSPTPFQYNVFRIVLALASGGVAAMIPGFLTISISNWIRGGGALGVFIVVYFYSPAKLTGVTVKTEQEIEIEKPVVQASPPGSNLPSLVVEKSDEFSDERAFTQRYQLLKVDGAAVKMPLRATVVADEIEGLQGGKFIGTDFSIVARRLANVTIDARGAPGSGAPAGAVRLYVKLIENVRILAGGAIGKSGDAGDIGTNGDDGANGRDGACEGFGGYHGADPGRQGGDAGNGHAGQPGADGQPGGFVAIITIVNPVGNFIDVTGGQGGIGGVGGPAGTPGRGGVGGRGCTGLGGSQPNQSDGRNGLPGLPGQPGQKGRDGAVGEYRLQIVKSFDPIIQKLKTNANVQLHAALIPY